MNIQNGVELTPVILAGVVGVLVSLLASYAPGFRTRWAALEPERKQLIMVGLNIGTGVLVYVLACTPSFLFPFVACPADGIWSLVATIFSAVVANQNADRLSPDTADVKAVKAGQLDSRLRGNDGAGMTEAPPHG